MDDRGQRCVLIGAPDDPHFSAVASLVSGPLVVDVQSLQTNSLALSAGGPLHKRRNGWVSIRGLGRGWIRRLAPPGWMLGTEAHTRRAYQQANWLAMLVSFIRTSSVDWLTDLDRLLIAENKLLLKRAAQAVGAASPETALACSPTIAAEILGTDQLIAKPIGPSSFLSDSDYVSTPTSDVSQLIDIELQPEPFLYQHRVEAVRHLRVVTVGDQSWCFSRAVVEGEPIDWRFLNDAHTNFRWTKSMETEKLAVSLARELAVGYSSQDWIYDGNTTWVVDINPGGQWLFLGERSHEITVAIAGWLNGYSYG